MDADFSNRIVFSYGALLHFAGIVNLPKGHIRGSEKPGVTIERKIHPQSVRVWGGFWASSQMRLVMQQLMVLPIVMIPFLFLIPMIWIWTTHRQCHMPYSRRDNLITVWIFPDPVISRSCDLTPLEILSLELFKL